MDTARDIICALNSEQKLSDAEIARQVGSSQPTIWRIRTGKTADCSSALYRELLRLRSTNRPPHQPETAVA